jgi:hypothetical protein
MIANRFLVISLSMTRSTGETMALDFGVPSSPSSQCSLPGDMLKFRSLLVLLLRRVRFVTLRTLQPFDALGP